jgi:hypothetical protein
VVHAFTGPGRMPGSSFRHRRRQFLSSISPRGSRWARGGRRTNTTSVLGLGWRYRCLAISGKASQILSRTAMSAATAAVRARHRRCDTLAFVPCHASLPRTRACPSVTSCRRTWRASF